MKDSADPSARRRNVLRALGVAGVAGLAGCSVNTGGDGGDGTDSGESTTSSTGGDGGPSMANSATGWSWNVAAKSLKIASESYNEENDADVSITEMGGDTWEQRFQTAILSGTGAPDFSSVQNYDVTSFGAKDGLMDLTSRIEDADIEDKIISGKWETVSVDGNYYAMPWDIGPTGVFYKRGAYESAGIDAMSIETWDDFIEAGKKLPDDTAMMNLPTQEMPQLWRMLYRQLGGQAFTESGAVNIHSDKSVRVAQLLLDMKEAGITTRIGMWSGGWFTSFSEDSLVSLPSAAWMDGTLRAELPDTAGNWGVYKLPAFDEGGVRASNRGGSNMAIPAQIDDDGVIERSWDFIEYAMTNPEIQNQILQEYGIFPSLKSAYESDIYDEELDFYDGQPVFRLFAEVAEQIQGYRYTVDTPEVQDALNTELNNMLDGKKSPENAVRDAAETVVDRTDRELA